MDKAARAVRRSGVRLLSLSAGHSDLSVLISEVKDMRNTEKAFSNAQKSACQYMVKWAANEENRAIQDSVYQVAELNMLWTEAQKEFAEDLKEFRHMFEMVLEGEKHVGQAKANLAGCEQREARTRKELKKAAKKATADEIRQLENKLLQAERAKDMAQLEIADRVRENDVVKMIRLKEGLLKVSEAYIEFGKKCSMIFEAQQDIAYELPDVHGRDLEDIKYTGTGATKFYVQQVKQKIRQYQRKSHHILPSSTALMPDEPPPPYSASDYIQPTYPIDRTSDYSHEYESTAQPRYTSPPHRQNTLDDDPGDQSDDDLDDLNGAMGGVQL